MEKNFWVRGAARAAPGRMVSRRGLAVYPAAAALKQQQASAGVTRACMGPQ